MHPCDTDVHTNATEKQLPLPPFWSLGDEHNPQSCCITIRDDLRYGRDLLIARKPSNYPVIVNNISFYFDHMFPDRIHKIYLIRANIHDVLMDAIANENFINACEVSIPVIDISWVVRD